MDLQELGRLQAEFDSSHGSSGTWNARISEANVQVLEHLVVCLTGEVGEFANIVKKIVRGDRSYGDALPNLTEEIADTFIYLIKICNQVGIDLEDAYLKRLKFNKERFKRYAI